MKRGIDIDDGMKHLDTICDKGWGSDTILLLLFLKIELRWMQERL